MAIQHILTRLLRLSRPSYLLAIAAGASLAGAWLMPGTVPCALLGWLSVFCLAAIALKFDSPYHLSYQAGFLGIGIAFYWLYHTISYFGGFSFPASTVLFALFVTVSAFQFVIFIFLYEKSPDFLKKTGFSLAAAWVSSELLSPNIFPWEYGHTQLAFTHFAQIASISSSHLISFMMFWLAESIIKGSKRKVFISLLAFAFCLLYGEHQIQNFRSESSPKQSVAIIQANISIEEKHAEKSFSTNIDRYIALSKDILQKNTLIIWPESVITKWIYDGIETKKESPILEQLPAGNPYLVGALTFQSKKRYFNSALAMLPSGKVLAPYHKRVLMPFGEFTPLAQTFPWLKDINSTAGEFSAGNQEQVFNYALQREDGSKYTFSASPLICYEDIVPSMARDSVRAGAQILVNLTNDAWYGNSVEPFQHHLIASFRAIENARYLIRSTNTGFSAVVNPLGETTSSIPVFSEEKTLAEVGLRSDLTPYTRYFSNFPFWLLFALICIGLISKFYRGAKANEKTKP